MLPGRCCHSCEGNRQVISLIFLPFSATRHCFRASEYIVQPSLQWKEYRKDFHWNSNRLEYPSRQWHRDFSVRILPPANRTRMQKQNLKLTKTRWVNAEKQLVISMATSPAIRQSWLQL